jgi:hypothetical protein
MKINKILILVSKEKHAYRIVTGFGSLGVRVDVINALSEYTGEEYDVAFLDHSSDDDARHINCKEIIFYDCEDNPEHFKPGKLFFSLVDKSNFYAKLVYYEGDKIFNKLNPIAIPIQEYSLCHDISNKFGFNDFKPKVYFRGAPTYYAIASKDYCPINTKLYRSFDDTTSLGFEPGLGVLYNQRVDWLSQIYNNNDIEQDVGIVFKEHIDCYSLKFQTKCFGNVSKFSKPAIPYINHLINLWQNKVCLCPLGHDRISFRVLDCVALGSIIAINDFANRKMLYMPKHYTIIPDGANLLDHLDNIFSNYPSIIKSSQENKEVFKNKIPENILKDFINQML